MYDLVLLAHNVQDRIFIIFSSTATLGTDVLPLIESGCFQRLFTCCFRFCRSSVFIISYTNSYSHSFSPFLVRKNIASIQLQLLFIV